MHAAAAGIMDKNSEANPFFKALIVQSAAFPLPKGNGVNPAKVERAAN